MNFINPFRLKSILVRLLIFVSVLDVASLYSQNNKILATNGLGSDNEQILSFLRQNPVWFQKTEFEQIRIEFIDFEKSDKTSKPFSFGIKNKMSESPVAGLSFSKMSDKFQSKLSFGSMGEVSFTVRNSSPIFGTYNYIQSENKLYINIGQSISEYQIESLSGKRLGISGEEMPDIRLRNVSISEEYVSDSYLESDLFRKANLQNFYFPENRYLIRYEISHSKPVLENGSVNYKKVVEIKYMALTNIKVTDRYKPQNHPYDPYNTYLSDSTLKWKIAELKIISSLANNQKYLPNYINTHNVESVGTTIITLCDNCPSTDNNTYFQYKNNTKLFINNAVNNAGSGLSTNSNELTDNFYLCSTPAVTNKKLNDNLTADMYVAYIDEAGNHGFMWPRMIVDPNDPRNSNLNISTHQGVSAFLEKSGYRLPTLKEMQEIYNNKEQLFRKPQDANEEVWVEDAFYGQVDFETSGNPVYYSFRLSDGAIFKRPSNTPLQFIYVRTY
jgi:hypothetical protein